MTFPDPLIDLLPFLRIDQFIDKPIWILIVDMRCVLDLFHDLFVAFFQAEDGVFSVFLLTVELDVFLGVIVLIGEGNLFGDIYAVIVLLGFQYVDFFVDVFVQEDVKLMEKVITGLLLSTLIQIPNILPRQLFTLLSFHLQLLLSRRHKRHK